MKIQRHIIIVLSFCMLAACDTGSQNALKREALQEEMRNRAPKKLSEGDIIQETYRQGQQLAQAAQESLLATLQEAMREQGIVHAVEYCNLAALPLMDSLSEAHNALIKRSSLQLRNPKNKPSDLEKQLLEAYQYNAEEGLALEDNVQGVDQKYLLYTKPIVFEKELCLNCHGQPGKEILPQTLSLLDSLYPGDKARGYQKGDLRGIWSIRFRKKDIVNAL